MNINVIFIRALGMSVDFCRLFVENDYMFKVKHPLYNIPIAHRGFHSDSVDENSLASFKLAIAAGFGIEIDVHMTKDDKVIVLHDATTGRTMDGDLKVSDVTYAELLKLKLKKTGEHLPLLSEVLTLIDGRVPLLIELKAENSFSPHFVSTVLEVIKPYPYKDMLGLQSFNPYVVRDLRLGQKGIIVGQLLSDVLPGQSKFVHFMYRTLLVLKISKPHFFSYDVTYIHKRRIKRQHKKMPLLAWTIDSSEKYAKAKTLADNIIFEHINL